MRAPQKWSSRYRTSFLERNLLSITSKYYEKLYGRSLFPPLQRPGFFLIFQFVPLHLFSSTSANRIIEMVLSATQHYGVVLCIRHFVDFIFIVLTECCRDTDTWFQISSLNIIEFFYDCPSCSGTYSQFSSSIPHTLIGCATDYRVVSNYNKYKYAEFITYQSRC